MMGFTTSTAESVPVRSLETGTDFLVPRNIIDVFERAAAANLGSDLRRGSTIYLPPKGRLTMTGDLHDHGVNLQRIVKLADLDSSPDHHLVLHEIIHGSRRVHGADMSVLTLARVASLKLQYPDQVHLIQSNHELAQIGGEGISKAGVNVVHVFDEGLDFVYEACSDAVREALSTYIRSLALVVKCPNGVICSHSLPSPYAMKRFDPSVIDRAPTHTDYQLGGSAYELVWGRRQTQKVADYLGDLWGGDVFLLGHQVADMGYRIQENSMLILASNHDHGMALPFDLAKSYTLVDLVDQLVPLAAVSC